MSAGITLVAFNGKAINAAPYQALIELDSDLASSYGAESVESETPASFPVLVRTQPQGRDFTLHIWLLTPTRANFEQLDQWLSPLIGEGYLTADDDQGTPVRRRLLCAPLKITRTDAAEVLVSMRAATGVWEADAETYLTQTIAATGAYVTATNAGNTKTRPRLTLTPTAQKASANGLRWRRRVSLAHRSERELSDPVGDGYPLDLGDNAFDTDALNTAGKLQADLDDLRVYHDGADLNRWLDPATDDPTTKIWTNLRCSPMKKVILSAAMASGASPAAGATFVVSNPEGTAGWLHDAFLLVGSECLHLQVWSATEFLVLQRGALGTTAAAHSAGDAAYWVEHPYLALMYDWSSAANPNPDPDRKPLPDLALSLNTKFLWSGPFLVPAGTRRSGGWQPQFTNDGVTSGNIRLYEGGKARQFTRANSEYFTLADNAALSMGDIDFAACAWVYLDTKPAAAGILGKWNGTGNNREYLLSYESGADRFIFRISSDGIAAVAQNADVLGAPALATWYFIVVEHDAAANTISIRVNNGAANSVAHTGGAFDGTSAFQAGAYEAANTWDGRMTRGAVWKRLLTADEKTWLHNLGKGRRYDELPWALKTSLTEWWELNEASGNALAAHSTNALTDTATVTQADGVVPGDVLLFEDTLPAAGKPRYNNVYYDAPCGIKPVLGGVELDEIINNNMLLHGYLSDRGGYESRLITQGPTAALVNQQFTPTDVAKRLRLNGRIGAAVGNSVIIPQYNLTISDTLYFSQSFVLDASETIITGVVVRLRKSGGSTANVRAEVWTDTSGVRGTLLTNPGDAVISNASIGAAYAWIYVAFVQPLKLSAGRYHFSLFKTNATGTIEWEGAAARVHGRGYQVYSNNTVLLSVVMAFIALTQITAAQFDAPLESGDDITLDNLELTFDDATPRTPLIVRGAEEAMYLIDARIRNVRNVCINGSFESNVTGWTPQGTNTIAVSREQAHYDRLRGFEGSQSAKATYNNNVGLGDFGITLPAAGIYTLSAWVFVPANYDGGGIELDLTNFVGSAVVAGSRVDADMTNKDGSWQQLKVSMTIAGGDLIGNVRVNNTGAVPTAGRSVYIDDVQVEPGPDVYGSGYYATDGDFGGDYVDLYFASALNQSLVIDCEARNIIDRELNLPVHHSLVASNPEEWVSWAPGLNVLRYEEVGATSLTFEAAHRGRFL